MAQPHKGKGGSGLPAKGDRHRPRRTRRTKRSVVETLEPTEQEVAPAQVVAAPLAAPVEAPVVPEAPEPVASVPPVRPISVEAAAAVEHQKALLSERLIWITGTIISWSVTTVALMRVFGLF
jgi:hypothetical protein